MTCTATAVGKTVESLIDMALCSVCEDTLQHQLESVKPL